MGELRVSKLIKETLRIYDRTQIEATLSLGMKPRVGEKRIVPKRYSAEFFFRFPNQMNINRRTFPIETFYRQINSYIRFREPKLSYKAMIGFGDYREASGIHRIRQYLESCIRGELQESPEIEVDAARIFGCSFYSFYERKFSRNLARLAEAPGYDEARVERTLYYLDRLHAILEEWRELVRGFDPIPKSLLINLRSEVVWVDEYCSYIFRDAIFETLEALDEMKSRDPKGEYGGAFDRVLAYCRLEHGYASKAGFYWCHHDQPLETIQKYLYRRDALKRRIWACLYLQHSRKPIHRLQKQLGPMLAAAFAGAWAVVVSIAIGVDIIRDAQGVWSLNVALLVMVFTVSYVLKDRIKEWGRSKFSSGLLGKVPDSSEKIFYQIPGVAKSSKRVGDLFESAHYLTTESVPSDVRGVFDKSPIDLDSYEDRVILRYSKRIDLHRRSVAKLHGKLKRIHDIMRLNISPLLQSIGDPIQSLILPQGSRLERAEIKKFYRIHLVIKVTPQLIGGGLTKPYLRGYEIFINKNGLHQIQPLDEPG